MPAMRQGQMLLHRMRRAQAIYEVVEESEGLVTVIVVEGGALAPGSVHRFLLEDIALMEPLAHAESERSTAATVRRKSVMSNGLVT